MEMVFGCQDQVVRYKPPNEDITKKIDDLTRKGEKFVHTPIYFVEHHFMVFAYDKTVVIHKHPNESVNLLINDLISQGRRDFANIPLYLVLNYHDIDKCETWVQKEANGMVITSNMIKTCKYLNSVLKNQ
jgi:hypothetical protein